MTADSRLLVLMTEISLVLPLQKPSKAGFLIAASSFQPTHRFSPTHSKTHSSPNNMEMDCLGGGGGVSAGNVPPPDK